MAVDCPNCSHELKLKSPRPGRFRPNCPRCGLPFLLIVPEAAGEAMEVRRIPTDTVASPMRARAKERPEAGGSTPPATAGDAVAVFEDPEATSGGQFRSPIRTTPGGNAPAEPPRISEPTPQPSKNNPLPKLAIRGYEIERELGRGGMGSVYLARQLSLDRPVALKLMSKRWAADPVFVARFTREAYAAAQLSHPNIVHIHDIGEVEGTRFFSMEYVPGRSLADLVRSQGKLDPETAVGYVLQAARGLEHAHARGMIHRDVKPDNLLLDEQGLVKVADLGLVKTPATRRQDDRLSGNSGTELGKLAENMTGARIALGTPAYMSPEQCRDAAAVDHRADIYSLGCTLYVLVTGRTPFEGTTDVELMTKHAYDPLVPPEQIVSRVPRAVSEVIQRMMAKNADDRYQSMAEVIRTLEAWLGVHHTGTFSPQEEQISKLECYTLQFNDAPMAVLRRRLITGYFASLALTAVLILFFGKVVWSFGVFGLGIQSMLAYFVLDGIFRRGHLFTRTRQFVMGLSWGDWAVGSACGFLFCLLLAMLQSFWIWVGFGLIGGGLAFALRYILDRAVDNDRRATLEACERLLRRMRLQGLDEEELRLFVAKFAGRHWEAFFEALFGYEAKLTARAVLLRGGAAGVREKHAAWREPLIAVMDRIEAMRREARERQLLEAVEKAQLLAAGATPDIAENQARAAAEAMVEAAGKVRKAEVQRARASSSQHAAHVPVNIRSTVLEPEQNPFAFAPASRDPFGRVVWFFTGPHIRALAAALLLAACALWALDNRIVRAAEIQNQTVQAVESRDMSQLAQAASSDFRKGTQPLRISGVPADATAWVDGWNAGFAGLLLLGSLFYRGNVMAVLVLLGAAVAAVGHQHGIKTVEPFRAEHITLMLGAAITLLGYRMGTR